jgi:magnesium-transporting ATPase (P-type)
MRVFPHIAQRQHRSARPDAAPKLPAMSHWALEPQDALRALEAAADGLSEAEAERRLERHGRNEVAEGKRGRALGIALGQFTSPLIAILLVAAVVTLALREFVDAGVIAAVLVLNAIIGFSQEYRAERSLEALRQLARAVARVVRDGRERELDAALLVPGDVVLLEAGTKVPADCRLLRAVALEADESLLTGESAPVAKSVAPVAPETPLADRSGMLHTGTVVTRGHGRGLVVATGAATELGRVAGAVETIGEPATPLQRRMTRFSHVIGVAVLAVGVVGFVLGWLAGEDLEELFLAVVALAVAAIPEGLPIVLTVVLAIGVRRMARRHTIVRRLPAVEALGSCTVIGSDKTGTLTENRMTVQTIVAGGRTYEVTGGGYGTAGEIRQDGRPAVTGDGSPLRLTLVAGALCNDASAVAAGAEFHVSGDPTEIALLVAAAKAGLDKDELEEEWVRVAEVPFDPDRRYAITFNRRDGSTYAFVKGAPEEVLAMSASAAAGRFDPREMLAEADALAARGLRVLAVAYRELGDEPADALAARGAVDGLVFLGLQAMIDPPRAEAAAAVRGCQDAGVRVVMITGDHARTAAAIAAALGIAGAERGGVTGVEIETLSDEELQGVVRERSVFARVAPEHKLRIVRALQAVGETVAVTGDGVNDAPALKAADVGAAMGRSGTDVAKEAADIVVTDDNFESVFAAVEEGRIAFDNVRKTTFFLVSTAAGLVAAVLISIAARFSLPFVPAQLLWLNLVTNGVQDVALAFEPGEKDVLKRPPRRRGEGVLSPLLWERTAVAGAVMCAGTLALFLLELDRGTDLDRARTVALTTVVLFQVFHVGNSRSEHRSAFAKSPLSNRFLFVGTIVALTIHIGALYFPPTQFVLRVEPLDAATWLRMIAVASTIIVAMELHKLLRGPGRAAYTGRPEAS